MMFILLGLFLVVEFLFTWTFKHTFTSLQKKKFYKLCLWTAIPLWLSILLVVAIQLLVPPTPHYLSYSYMFYVFTFYFVIFIPKVFFIIVWLILKGIFLFQKQSLSLSQWRWTPVAVSLIMLVLFIWSVCWGQYMLTVNRYDVSVKKLPVTFSKFKIIQFSDLHIGSYGKNPVFLQKFVDSCNALKPDIIVFTGDIVNQYADEIDQFDTVLKRMHATLGKFAVLGNHDFGDYSVWKSPKDKQQNLSDIISHLNNMGFKVLRNEHVYVHKGNDSLVVVGVDNWGLKPFKQYGDLNKAIQGIDSNCFAVILSHDPTHWEEQIKKRLHYSLTFSGHTHAFQMGFHAGKFKWSPAELRYKHWWGLYAEKNNFLYVSRGVGTIGFLGRLGMTPEMVCVTLNASNE